MGNIVVSAQVVCYINGKIYGKVTGFSFNSSTPKKEIRGIDSAEPYELAPTITSLSGTVNVLRLIGDGGIEGDQIGESFENVINERYFTLLLIERQRNTILFKADQCSVVSQSWDIPAKGICSGSISFIGITWQNEATI